METCHWRRRERSEIAKAGSWILIDPQQILSLSLSSTSRLLALLYPFSFLLSHVISLVPLVPSRPSINQALPRAGSRMRRLRRVAAFPIKPCALRKLGCGSASVLSLFRPPPAAPAFLARSPLVAPAGLAARALVNRHFGLPPIAAPPAPPSLLKRMEKRRIDAERAAEKRAGEAFMAASKPKRVRASQLVAAAALGPLGGIPPLLPLATPPTLLPIPTALIGPTPPLASNPLFRGLLEAERKARCKHEAVKPAPSENCDWHGFEDSKGCVKTFKCVPKEPR